MSRSPRKIHVVHIVWSFGIGGTENGIVNLINHSSDRIQHSVIALTELGASTLRIHAPDVYTAALSKVVGHDIGAIFRLAKRLKSLRPDIVHCRGWATYFESAIAAKMAGVPTLIHGEQGTTYFDKQRRVIAYRLLKHITSHYITVAEYLEKALYEIVLLKKSQVSYIPNGVDNQKFKPDDKVRLKVREELGLKPTDFVVGSVGRLAPVKGYDILVRAIAELQKKNSAIKAILVGDGPLMNDLSSLAADAAAQIHFMGNSDRVHELYQALDLYVCSSHSEGMSNTILEALACGLPVAATAVGGNIELVRKNENGVLFPANDLTALVEVILRLEKNRALCLDMGKRACQIVQKEFSQQAMIDKYVNLYEKNVDN